VSPTQSALQAVVQPAHVSSGLVALEVDLVFQPGILHGFALERSTTQPPGPFDGATRTVLNHEYELAVQPGIVFERSLFQSEFNASSGEWTDVLRLQIPSNAPPISGHVRVDYVPNAITILHPGDVELQPGILHGFAIEKSSTQPPANFDGETRPILNHAYSLQLFPSALSLAIRIFQSEYNAGLGEWTDVLRLQLANGSVQTKAHVLVYYPDEDCSVAVVRAEGPNLGGSFTTLQTENQLRLEARASCSSGQVS
jgi:hypothetical protein